MTKHTKQKLLISVFLILPLCLAVSCFLYPPEIRYSDDLSPNVTSNDTSFKINDETKVYSYDLGGSDITVRYVKTLS